MKLLGARNIDFLTRNADFFTAKRNRTQQSLNNRGIQTASQLAADRASIDAGNAKAQALWASNRIGETTGIQNTVIHEGPTSMYSSMKASQSQNPGTFNPGIKATGAPVPFSPTEQSAMTGAFGMPADGSYDRTMDTMV
jgi:hypothetical protein